LIAREKKEITGSKALVSPLSRAQKGFTFSKGETFNPINCDCQQQKTTTDHLILPDSFDELFQISIKIFTIML
jgi:hypothetical protein